jgi:hypothetical protein
MGLDIGYWMLDVAGSFFTTKHTNNRSSRPAIKIRDSIANSKLCQEHLAFFTLKLFGVLSVFRGK